MGAAAELFTQAAFIYHTLWPVITSCAYKGRRQIEILYLKEKLIQSFQKFIIQIKKSNMGIDLSWPNQRFVENILIPCIHSIAVFLAFHSKGKCWALTPLWLMALITEEVSGTAAEDCYPQLVSSFSPWGSRCDLFQ